MIYLGNKGNAPLETFHAEIEVTNFLRWGPKTQRIITSPSIATGGSVSLNVRFHAMKPFVSPPQLRISYIVGNKEWAKLSPVLSGSDGTGTLVSPELEEETV